MADQVKEREQCRLGVAIVVYNAQVLSMLFRVVEKQS